MFIPTSKGTTAMLLVLALIGGAMGVEQGHAGHEEIEKSDLDLPNQEQFESESTELPEFAADGYSRLISNMMHGMVAWVMWAYSHGHALGQMLQWLPETVVVLSMRAVSFGSLLGLAGWKLLRATQQARGTR